MKQYSAVEAMPHYLAGLECLAANIDLKNDRRLFNGIPQERAFRGGDWDDSDLFGLVMSATYTIPALEPKEPKRLSYDEAVEALGSKREIEISYPNGLVVNFQTFIPWADLDLAERRGYPITLVEGE